MDKILSSIKVLLNVESTITAFDNELLMHINAAISELTQGGVGPQEGLNVTDNTDWSEFSTDTRIVSASKEYVYCKTRLVWDPPTNSFTCDALKQRAEESYWRAYLDSDEIRKAQNNE